MRMCTAQSLPLDHLGAGTQVAWGSRGARVKAVAQRPEPLANHWPQLLRWTERQAPNVNIGVCIAEQLCLGDLDFTTCHFLNSLGS